MRNSLKGLRGRAFRRRRRSRGYFCFSLAILASGRSRRGTTSHSLLLMGSPGLFGLHRCKDLQNSRHAGRALCTATTADRLLETALLPTSATRGGRCLAVRVIAFASTRAAKRRSRSVIVPSGPRIVTDNGSGRVPTV